MLCQEVMKRDVKWVGPDESLTNAARMMRDENVGFLPVCDEFKRVVGTLTDRDITVRFVAGDQSKTKKVRDVMTDGAITCRPGDALETAEALMGENKKSRIVCVDDDECLEGVISLSDVGKLERAVKSGQTLRKITEREAKS